MDTLAQEVSLWSQRSDLYVVQISLISVDLLRIAVSNIMSDARHFIY